MWAWHPCCARLALTHCKAVVLAVVLQVAAPVLVHGWCRYGCGRDKANWLPSPSTSGDRQLAPSAVRSLGNAQQNPGSSKECLKAGACGTDTELTSAQSSLRVSALYGPFRLAVRLGEPHLLPGMRALWQRASIPYRRQRVLEVGTGTGNCKSTLRRAGFGATYGDRPVAADAGASEEEGTQAGIASFRGLQGVGASASLSRTLRSSRW